MSRKGPYSVFTRVVKLEASKGACVLIHKAYKADNPKTVDGLLSKGWMKTFFYGTREECKKHANAQNGKMVLLLQDDIRLLEAKIEALRKASK